MEERQQTTYDLAEVREAHAEIERESNDGTLREYLLPSIDAWLQMLLDCHAFAIDCRLREEHSALMEAYASVSSVAYSNTEMARTALVRGFYGNVFVLVRSLAMANDLVIDLVKTPESPEKWLALREFKPGKGGNQAERLRDYFKDGTLRQRVKETGEYSPSIDLYSILSDPVHTSPWSTHMFSQESVTEPGNYSIQYAPQFHPVRALMCGGIVVLTLPHLSGYFLEYCSPLYSQDQRYCDLAQRHHVMIQQYDEQSQMHEYLLNQFDAAQQRLRDGKHLMTSSRPTPRAQPCGGPSLWRGLSKCYAVAATRRPGRSRSGGGGAGFTSPYISCCGTSSRSSSIVHMPCLLIWRIADSSCASAMRPPFT